jgi:hypothetical protein
MGKKGYEGDPRDEKGFDPVGHGLYPLFGTKKKNG